jgi:hypothetical protein
MENEVIKTEEVIPKILIGISILTWTHRFAESFLQLWTELMTYQHKGRRFHVGYKFEYRKPVHMAQESLAEFAVNCNATHLLLMDDDIFDVKVEDVLKLLDADKDVIAGVMYTRSFPHAMCAFRRHDLDTRVAEQPILSGPARLYEIPPEQRTGIQPADLVPFGLTLIKTSIFKKIEKPWFKCDNQAPTDSWFMDSIFDAGLQPFVHFGVWLDHDGVNQITQPFLSQMGMAVAQAKNAGNIVGLTPEEMSRHIMAMEIKMKEAEAERNKREIEKQAFFEKSEESVIATPVINGEIQNAVS